MQKLLMLYRVHLQRHSVKNNLLHSLVFGSVFFVGSAYAMEPAEKHIADEKKYIEYKREWWKAELMENNTEPLLTTLSEATQQWLSSCKKYQDNCSPSMPNADLATLRSCLNPLYKVKTEAELKRREAEAANLKHGTSTKE
jgi:hypothetical protein